MCPRTKGIRARSHQKGGWGVGGLALAGVSLTRSIDGVEDGFPLSSADGQVPVDSVPSVEVA